MKKLKLISAVILMIALTWSCNLTNLENMTDWDQIVGLDLTPTLIQKVPKVYPGGNADCSNIGIAGLIQTTGRNNYNPSNDTFEGNWPSGLLVKVDDDKSVSFQIAGSIDFGDGKCYRIGAVIVKGSDASNVYDYSDLGGVTMDKGLVPPASSSGSPAGLSNLTFCFIQCPENPAWVIALKSYIKIPGVIDYSAAVSAGQDSEINSMYIGYNTYNFAGQNIYPLVERVSHQQIGTITATHADNVLRIVIDTNSDQWVFYDTYLYVGSLNGFNSHRTPLGNGTYSIDFGNFPFNINGDSYQVVFEIPFSSITE